MGPLYNEVTEGFKWRGQVGEYKLTVEGAPGNVGCPFIYNALFIIDLKVLQVKNMKVKSKKGLQEKHRKRGSQSFC